MYAGSHPSAEVAPHLHMRCFMPLFNHPSSLSSVAFPGTLVLLAALGLGLLGCGDGQRWLTGPDEDPSNGPPDDSTPPEYRVATLGTLGGESGWARGINARDEVVGVSRNAAGDLRAFHWSDDDMRELEGLGGSFSGAYDINDDGLIVGEAETAEGDVRAVLWAAGAVLELGTLGGSYSQAQAVNARGDVVGVSETADGDLRPFLWREGHMEELPVPPAGEQHFAAAFAINDAGQVVGTRAGDLENALQEGLLWTIGPAGSPASEAEVVALGSPCFEHAALGVNNAGLIVGGGLSCPISTEILPLRWKGGGESEYLEPLGGLQEPDAGQQNVGSAAAVNGGGSIVGWSDAEPEVWEREQRATLWKDDEPIDLSNGTAGSSAADVNEEGVAVGRAGDVPALYVPGGSEARFPGLDLDRRAAPPVSLLAADRAFGSLAGADWAVKMCASRGNLGPPPTASGLLAGCP